MRHEGAVAVVMGGGPSLPEQVAGLPDDWLWISANQHGARLRWADYIVCVDDIRDKLTGLKAPVISAQPWADIRLLERPQYPYSGQYAVWVAWLLGARLVLLAGMDLYQTGTYWHDRAAHSSATLRPYDGHLRGWQQVRLPVPIRALGGPLAAVFGAYDPAEVLPDFRSDRLELLSACSGVWVQFRKDWRLKGVDYPDGAIVEMPSLYARDLIQRRVVRPYEVKE